MLIDSRTVDGVLVVSLTGDLDSVTAGDVQTSMQELLETDGRLLIDLSGVAYMSSAGLRAMLLIHRQTERLGCRMGLLGLSGDLRRTMASVGFLEHFALCDSVAAGVRLLGTPIHDTA